ncbi:hypothetical protein RPC_4385 [Rhodopseudomonas palustris BisB18]|uniref:Uncharacterized protein n=1 Tax=Rhodopseudomonas palustris (strain BisB18) TaxID=316056 RepID=Q20Y78_RHOPB
MINDPGSFVHNSIKIDAVTTIQRSQTVRLSQDIGTLFSQKMTEGPQHHPSAVAIQCSCDLLEGINRRCGDPERNLSFISLLGHRMAL